MRCLTLYTNEAKHYGQSQKNDLHGWTVVKTTASQQEDLWFKPPGHLAVLCGLSATAKRLLRLFDIDTYTQFTMQCVVFCLPLLDLLLPTCPLCCPPATHTAFPSKKNLKANEKKTKSFCSIEKQIQSIQRFRTKIQSSNLFFRTLIKIPTTILTQRKEGRSQSSEQIIVLV